MKRRKRKAPRRRNVYAALVRRYGHRVKASAKVYKRKTKHRNPRPEHGGGFVLGSRAAFGWDTVRHHRVRTFTYEPGASLITLSLPPAGPRGG
jgi:hypothetical protein